MTSTRALTLLAAAGLALTSCSATPGAAGQSASQPLTGAASAPTVSTVSTVSAATATPTPTPTTQPSPIAAPALHNVVVYYLGDTTNGPRLYRELHRHAVTTGV